MTPLYETLVDGDKLQLLKASRQIEWLLVTGSVRIAWHMGVSFVNTTSKHITQY